MSEIETVLPIPEFILKLLSDKTSLFFLLLCIVFYLTHECMYYRPFFYIRRWPGTTTTIHCNDVNDKNKKVTNNKHILCTAQKIGHRGCRLDGIPENSIASFKHALRHEMDVLELDVWITKDLEVVVFHDKTMGRMTGDKYDGQCISDLYYTELPPLRTDIPGQCEQIALYSYEEVTRIPRLSEVLDLLPHDKSMNIEIKQDSVQLFQQVVDIVTKKGKKHQVFWFSLEEKINKKLRQFDPTIPNIVSVEGFLKNMAIYYLGLMPFTNIPEQVYGITMEKLSLEKIRNERAIADVPDIIKRILAFLLQGHPPYILLCPKLFTHLRRRGIPVWFLNVQTEEELEIAINAGATAVLTDKVEWLNETMKRKNLRFKQLYE